MHKKDQQIVKRQETFIDRTQIKHEDNTLKLKLKSKTTELRREIYSGYEGD